MRPRNPLEHKAEDSPLFVFVIDAEVVDGYGSLRRGRPACTIGAFFGKRKWTGLGSDVSLKPPYTNT